jgi:hypothetical protein
MYNLVTMLTQLNCNFGMCTNLATCKNPLFVHKRNFEERFEDSVLLMFLFLCVSRLIQYGRHSEDICRYRLFLHGRHCRT